jgi:hypothetical protein
MPQTVLLRRNLSPAPEGKSVLAGEIKGWLFGETLLTFEHSLLTPS